jgi:hypothetical protein
MGSSARTTGAAVFVLGAGTAGVGQASALPLDAARRSSGAVHTVAAPDQLNVLLDADGPGRGVT